MDRPQAPTPVRLVDYRPPDWRVPRVDLRFELDPRRTLVHARLDVERAGEHDRPLVLDGEDLQTLRVAVDGEEMPLPNAAPLVLPIPGDRAVVETTVAVRPEANTRLMGLYASGGNLCTQCEAEGFRRITWFPDRPDVLARWRVRLEADAQAFPVLLSNGNPAGAGPLPGGRHFALWEDPHPKPCYLFALVAGRLAAARDRFVTASGRPVALAIWVAPDDLPRTGHAMAALKAAMRFDEEVYGREYDLDVFNIVAVRDFNFGAMENKGLNIFNARYVLADPATATDFDLDSVAAVVAHEYLHNWSGNRVTCRDWFQLSLKEGFTVFRDQQFSASIGSAAVRRIQDVRFLRQVQFPEDAGPLAHPVQPEHYLEISNFYTPTVYNKGAELIRMMARILGPAAFRRACDRYFADNDGKAATIDDFLAAMAAEGLDAERFRRWYRQAGTPRVTARLEPGDGGLALCLQQSNPVAGPEAPPLPIPLEVALLDPATGAHLVAPHLVVLQERMERIPFPGVHGPALLSINRGFTAPVRIEPAPDRATLARLAAVDDDPVARWDALQAQMLSAMMEAIDKGVPSFAEVVEAVRATLGLRDRDPAFVAEAILPPPEAVVAEAFDQADPAAVHAARQALRQAVGQACCDELWAAFDDASAPAADLSPRAKGLRRLKGVAIGLLMAADEAAAARAAFRMFEDADGMTDRWAALVALASSDRPERTRALAAFRARHGADPVLLDNWFAVQAGATRADTLAVVKALAQDPAYDRRNPNRVRALFLSLANNPARFHDPEAYRLLADEVLMLDALNPQTAARLAQPLARWRRLVPWLGQAMRAELERMSAAPGLSREVRDVVSRALA
ncbi:MAG: aminopeptidase N [Sphingomonadaceae bacterium]|uniref:aminopeptidase N n=1 Tax=Thermaurantiacus sp. TaxID=2820283 RepID=UPI00298F2848|nr:aminopeptidase N [Thermaurantiacus sp.]MCS6987458.1 aminopeptidase N [Sphingomonadaceae bacterium]MDW8415378.1 aminopeptidase N [Thermaurantiacus sp.]